MTTAYVAEQWGRRWITVDTSRVALALARTRIMSARYPYYLMADTPEGQRKESQLTGQGVGGPTASDIRKGFVYERVPHVTLKSIAQNPDIREGMSRRQRGAQGLRGVTRRGGRRRSGRDRGTAAAAPAHPVPLTVDGQDLTARDAHVAYREGGSFGRSPKAPPIVKS